MTNLSIPQYIEVEPVSQNIDDPLMKAIIKYRLHPSIIAIKEKLVSSFFLVSFKLNVMRS